MQTIQKIKKEWNEKKKLGMIPYEQESRQRIEMLRNIFKDKNTVIVTCGPSINNISNDVFKKLIDKGYIIVCVKQSIDKIPSGHCHFHVVNFCNEKQYVYTPSHEPISIYCQRSENNIVAKKGYDIVVSHYPNNLKDNIITAMLQNKDEMSFDAVLKRKQLKVKWGDIMYELAIPLSMFIGSKNIYILGWDCKNMKQHFYEKGNANKESRVGIREQLDKLQVQGGTSLHSHLKEMHNVNLMLVGKGTESVFEIPYITIDTLIN